MPLSPREPWYVKILFVTAFLGATSATYVLSTPLAEWVKTRSDLISSLPVQAAIAFPVLILVFLVEERVIWRLVREDVFSTVHPICMGIYIGYLIHFAL